jgi:hypothetical protein
MFIVEIRIRGIYHPRPFLSIVLVHKLWLAISGAAQAVSYRLYNELFIENNIIN